MQDHQENIICHKRKDVRKNAMENQKSRRKERNNYGDLIKLSLTPGFVKTLSGINKKNKYLRVRKLPSKFRCHISGTHLKIKISTTVRRLNIKSLESTRRDSSGSRILKSALPGFRCCCRCSSFAVNSDILLLATSFG